MVPKRLANLLTLGEEKILNSSWLFSDWGFSVYGGGGSNGTSVVVPEPAMAKVLIDRLGIVEGSSSYGTTR